MSNLNNASPIASILSTVGYNDKSADPNAVVWTESTIDLDLRHPAFDRSAFGMDTGNGMFFMEAPGKIMFGLNAAFENPTKESIREIVKKAKNDGAITQQKASVSAFADLVQRPEDFVIGLHNVYGTLYANRNYRGELLGDIKTPQLASALVAEIASRKLKDDSFFPVKVTRSLQGNLPTVQLVLTSLIESSYYKDYTHQAIDHLLDNELITFTWPVPYMLDDWLAVTLGSIQATVDGDELLIAQHKAHYRSAAAGKEAYRVGKARLESAARNGQVISFDGTLVGMTPDGEELDLMEVGLAIIGFKNWKGTTTSMTFNPGNENLMAKAERLLRCNETVEVLRKL